MLAQVFGTCDRVARLRAVLDALRLSEGGMDGWKGENVRPFLPESQQQEDWTGPVMKLKSPLVVSKRRPFVANVAQSTSSPAISVCRAWFFHVFSRNGVGDVG